MTVITVATWNMHQQQRTWDYLGTLRDRHGVQLALVQEAIRPVDPQRWHRIVPDPTDPSLWQITVPAGGPRLWASAIVLLDDQLTISPESATPLADASYGQLAASHPGQFAVARLGYPDASQEVVLISLYGLWHLPSGRDGAEATLHRALSDLAGLLLGTNPIVLAGDLNIFRNTNHIGQRRFNTIFDRLDAYDLQLAGPLRRKDAAPLVGCTCEQGHGCDHVETFRLLRPNARPYQDDYVFTTPTISVVSCFVAMDPAIRDQRLSDHWPVIAELELP